MRTPTSSMPPAPTLLLWDLSPREEQALVGVGALLVLVSAAADVLVLGQPSWPALAVRAAWALAMLVLVPGFRHSAARVRRRMHLLLALVSCSAFPLLVWVCGGARSPLFALSLVLPVAVVGVARHHLAAALVGVGGGLVSGVALPLLSGLAPREVALWGTLHGLTCALALTLALVSRRMRRAADAVLAAEERVRAELVSSEQRRLMSERLAAVGQLTGGVAHELNNPLAYVTANVRFLEEELTRAAPVREEVGNALREARQGLERMAHIVKDLKGFAREPSPMLSACDVSALVEDSLRAASLRLRLAARVDTEVPPRLPAVQADPHRLRQVLLNLLLNAADALEGVPRESARILVRAERVGGRVRLVVEDSGPGIPAELLGRLFTPFTPTNLPSKGTGLGLALSHEYVAQCGGSLRAENRPEGGARFVVELRAV